MRRVHSHNAVCRGVDGTLQRVFLGLALFCFICELGINPTLNAAGVRPVPIELLAAQADWIVHARVLSLESRRSTSFGITTAIELEVMESWKGGVTNRLVVSVAGGVLGNRRMTVTGQPEFRMGEEAILFLMRNDRQEGVLLELSQGKFEIRRDSQNRAFVSNSIYGAPDRSSSTSTTPASATGPSGNTAGVALAKVVPPHQLPLTLTELKRRVLNAISQ